METRRVRARNDPTGGGSKGQAGGASGSHERPRVLVVEDEPNDREIYGRILGYNGFDVVFADGVERALELTRRESPDLILLDLGLPTGSGLDVCAALRRRSDTADVPVIALTGYPEIEKGEAARRAGCTSYIEKPASPVAVLHAVEELIGQAPLPGVGRPPTILE